MPVGNCGCGSPYLTRIHVIVSPDECCTFLTNYSWNAVTMLSGELPGYEVGSVSGHMVF